jgi:hypothetical protein
LRAIIDALVQRDVAVVDIPNAFEAKAITPYGKDMAKLLVQDAEVDFARIAQPKKSFKRPMLQKGSTWKNRQRRFIPFKQRNGLIDAMHMSRTRAFYVVSSRSDATQS